MIDQSQVRSADRAGPTVAGRPPWRHGSRPGRRPPQGDGGGWGRATRTLVFARSLGHGPPGELPGAAGWPAAVAPVRLERRWAQRVAPRPRQRQVPHRFGQAKKGLRAGAAAPRLAAGGQAQHFAFPFLGFYIFHPVSISNPVMTREWRAIAQHF